MIDPRHVRITDHAIKRFRERIDPHATEEAIADRLRNAEEMSAFRVVLMWFLNGVDGANERPGTEYLEADGVVFVLAPDDSGSPLQP